MSVNGKVSDITHEDILSVGEWAYLALVCGSCMGLPLTGSTSGVSIARLERSALEKFVFAGKYRFLFDKFGYFSYSTNKPRFSVTPYNTST